MKLVVRILVALILATGIPTELFGDTLSLDCSKADRLLNSHLETYIVEKGESNIEDYPDWKWQPLSEINEPQFQSGPLIFFRIAVKNDCTETVRYFMNCVEFGEQIIFELRNGKPVKLLDGGSYATPSQTDSIFYRSFYEITLKPGEVRSFIIQSRDFQRISRLDRDFILRTELSATSWMLTYVNTRVTINVHDGILLGILGVMFVFFLFHYINDRKSRYYLWYVLYLAFLILYRLRDFEMFTNINVIFSHIKLSHHLTANPFLYGSFIFYALFVKEFLNLSRADRWGYRLINITIITMSVLIALDVAINAFIGLGASYAVSKYAYLWLLFPGLITVWLIYKRRGRLGRYILIGTACLLIFTLIAQLVRWGMITNILSQKSFSMYRQYPWGEPGFYMRTGIMLEVLIFSFGLSYKNKLEKIERAKSEMRALIGQIYNHQLKNGTMNLIGMIRDDKKDAAIGYVRDLSALMNEAVQLAGQSEITLYEELFFIENYLDLMRKAHGDFEYHVKVPDRNVLKEIYVPPLLLQPLIENAVQHGVAKTREGKWLRLQVDANSRVEKITIENSGPLFDPNSPHRTDSTGIKATRERLKYFADVNKADSTMTIEPGNEEGALVTIIIKHK